MISKRRWSPIGNYADDEESRSCNVQYPVTLLGMISIGKGALSVSSSSRPTFSRGIALGV